MMGCGPALGNHCSLLGVVSAPSFLSPQLCLGLNKRHWFDHSGTSTTGSFAQMGSIALNRHGRQR